MAWLSSAQIAALQQMDICVWLPVDEMNAPADTAAVSKADNNQTTAGESATTQANRPQPVAKAPRDPAKSVARLSQLREQLGRTGDSGTKDVPAPESETTFAGQPLSDAQKARYRIFIDDVERAWQAARPQQTLPTLAVGPALALTTQHLCLPALPDALSAAQKRHLWQTLCQN